MSEVKVTQWFAAIEQSQVFIKKWTPEGANHLPPVVLMHDSLGCVQLWRDFPSQLAVFLRREVIAYDRLGFGQSSSLSAVPGCDFIEREHEVFAKVKLAADIDQYVLFGHSVGGAMAVAIAAHDNDCIGVITEAAQAFVEDITLQGVRAAKVAFAQPAQIKRLEKYHGDKAVWVLSAWIDVWLADEYADWSLAALIDKVTCPVLAIHGDGDEFGSKAFPEFISSRCAGHGQMVWLDDCGHVPHKDQLDTVLEWCQSFMAKAVA